MELTAIELKRLKKLHDMLEWRLREGANGMQMAEAESLAWAIDIVEDCFGVEKF